MDDAFVVRLEIGKLEIDPTEITRNERTTQFRADMETLVRATRNNVGRAVPFSVLCKNIVWGLYTILRPEVGGSPEDQAPVADFNLIPIDKPTAEILKRLRAQIDIDGELRAIAIGIQHGYAGYVIEEWLPRYQSLMTAGRVPSREFQQAELGLNKAQEFTDRFTVPKFL